jgi:pilus assembly protein CpaC
MNCTREKASAQRLKMIAVSLSVALGLPVGSAAASEALAHSVEPARSPVVSTQHRSSGPVTVRADTPAGSTRTIGTMRPTPGDSDLPTDIGLAMHLSVGKSTLLRLPGIIDRISVGDPTVADVTLISGRELYLLGKTIGATNIIIWRKYSPTTIIDVTVGLDAALLQASLRELMPQERDIRVSTAADSVVLYGSVSSSIKAEQAVAVASAFARRFGTGIATPVLAGDQAMQPGQPIQITRQQGQGGQGGSAMGGAGAAGAQMRVVNMLQVSNAQQVMLEVTVAEISKALVDRLGFGLDGTRTSGNWRYGIVSNFLSGSSGVLGASRGASILNLDAEKRDGLVRVLAEPNIVALSGQEASFLAGGRVFIPVSQPGANTGAPTVTLQEKEFGVGLKFTPTVLDGDRINLQVAPEVSELSQTGSSFTTINGNTSVLPSFTTRRAQTSVQLRDGQSFVIAGLIRNNVTETVRRFPILGEVPILGALFRSSEFQNDRSELMFIVTPRLVKPLPDSPALPTDQWVPPNRVEFFLDGKMEGAMPRVPSSLRAPAAPIQIAPATEGVKD